MIHFLYHLLLGVLFLNTPYYAGIWDRWVCKYLLIYYDDLPFYNPLKHRNKRIVECEESM
jgi:hypothetical protein